LPLHLFHRIVVGRVTIDPSPRKEMPMTPSRRQFVASLSALPFLSQGAGAQPRGPASADPVVDQVVADLQALSNEFETQPRTRKATLRALESTLSVASAHFAAHYDATFRSSLRRRQGRVGRDAVIDDAITRSRDKSHEVSRESVESAMQRLEQRGLSGCFRDVQETVKRIRLQAPEQMQAVALPAAQFDYCADLNWQIEMTEAALGIICGIAILEPTPGGEAICGAVTLLLGILQAARYWWC
jgi:hypothetical protein